MKDFLKIFFILCGFVAAFTYGRNYGEQAFIRSDEYQAFLKEKTAKEEQVVLKTNVIENAKENIQSSSPLSSQSAQSLSSSAIQAEVKPIPIEAPAEKPEVVAKKSEAVRKPEKIFDYKKMKSYEWILSHMQTREDLLAGLKHVEIKDIDLFMKAVIDTKPEDDEKILGSYRGRIKDVTNKEYGTMILDLASVVKDNNAKEVKGNIRVFTNGNESSSYEFNRDQLGYRFEGSSGLVLPVQNRYFQLYKIPETQQVAGYYYERMVNGTTKTIGSFVLNRVDQF